MIDERYLLGYPKTFQDKCSVYPPKIRESLSNDKFTQYRTILTITQEDLEDGFHEQIEINPSFKVPTPFEYLLANSFKDKEFEKIARDAFQFFIHEPVSFLYEKKTILIGDIKEIVSSLKDIKELRFISEEDYFDFQNEIRQSLGEKKAEKPNPNEDPRVKRIKAKGRYRDRLVAKQGKGITLATSLLAICCMGIGITPLNIGELTFGAVSYIMTMRQEKEKYELDVESLLAGADSKKVKPKYWIRNLDS